MNKVYNSCINPSQFLPQLLTEENASIVLQAGKYMAEDMLPTEYYSSLGGNAMSQHWRNIARQGCALVQEVML